MLWAIMPLMSADDILPAPMKPTFPRTGEAPAILRIYIIYVSANKTYWGVDDVIRLPPKRERRLITRITDSQNCHETRPLGVHANTPRQPATGARLSRLRRRTDGPVGACRAATMKRKRSALQELGDSDLSASNHSTAHLKPVFALGGTAAPAVANSHRASEGDDESDSFWADIDLSGIVSDTLAAFQLLRSQFSTVVASKVRQRTNLLEEKRARFEVLCPVPAIPTSCLLANIPRTTLDAEVADLQNQRIARLLKLHSGDDEYALVLTADLSLYVDNKRAKAESASSSYAGVPAMASAASSSSSSVSSTQPPGTASSSTSRSAPAAVSADTTVDVPAAVIFYAYLANAFHRTVSVSHDDVVHCFKSWTADGRPATSLMQQQQQAATSKPNSIAVSARAGAGAGSNSSGTGSDSLGFIDLLADDDAAGAARPRKSTAASSSSSVAAAPSASARRTPISAAASSSSSSSVTAATNNLRQLDPIMRVLIQSGLLVRRYDAIRGSHSSVIAYWFGVPECGRLVSYLRDGRTELVSRLKRTHYKEMPKTELMKVKLSRSALSVDFHIRDGVGVGLVSVISTPAGQFVRLAAGQR